MTLVKRNNGFFPGLPSVFDDFTKDLFNWENGNYTGSNATLPAVNVKETEDDFQLEVAVPGMDKKDFHIELDNNLLIISSEKEYHQEEKDKDGNYSRREFSYQTFRRSFALPENAVEGDKVKAEYKDGILHVVVPKREEAKVKPSRQIEVA